MSETPILSTHLSICSIYYWFLSVIFLIWRFVSIAYIKYSPIILLITSTFDFISEWWPSCISSIFDINSRCITLLPPRVSSTVFRLASLTSAIYWSNSNDFYSSSVTFWICLKYLLDASKFISSSFIIYFFNYLLNIYLSYLAYLFFSLSFLSLSSKASYSSFFLTSWPNILEILNFNYISSLTLLELLFIPLF